MIESPGSVSKGRYVHIWKAGLATCALCDGDTAEAAKLYTSLRVEMFGGGHLFVGLLAWKLGRLNEAVDHLSAALEYKPEHSVWARLKLGEVLLERDEPGDKDAALDHIRKTREIALESHIVPIVKKAEAIMLSLEGKNPPKAARLPAELTPREAEVLGHLAAGKSDKEIGAELHISTRTVNRHVRNIFQKIGVGNRTEAALFAVKNQITTVPLRSEE